MKRQTSWTTVLLGATAVSVIIYLVRVAYTGKATYAFLMWNLFLAWVPYVLSRGMQRMKSAHISIKVGLFLGWLIFFPNAPYILTDLFHLSHIKNAPRWFDLIMILSFAWTGLLLAIKSLSHIESMLRNYWKPWAVHGMMGGILCLTAFGVYLGRFGRWNSWDILAQPDALMGDLVQMFCHPLAHGQSFRFSLIFALFLGMAYYSFIHLRNHQLSE